MKRQLFGRLAAGLQAGLDFGAVLAAFILGYGLYHGLGLEVGLGRGVQQFAPYCRLAVAAGAIMVFIFERFGLYSSHPSVLNMEEAKRTIKALMTGSALLFTFQFFYRDWFYSRLIVGYSMLAMFVLVLLERSLFLRAYQRSVARGRGLHRALIVGAGEAGTQLQRRLFENPRLGVRPVGFLDDDPAKQNRAIRGISGRPETDLAVLGMTGEMERVAREQHVDRVIIAVPSAPARKIYDWIRQATDLGLRFSYVPNLFDLLLQQVQFEDIQGVPLLRLKERQTSYLYLLAKRAFDVAFSLGVLAACLPLCPLIALCIRLDSPGPIFFSHHRVGRGGRRFTMYKFRTMHAGTDAYACTPRDSRDPRITRVGRWLRRFSLDEVPQFYNVLRGEMSVVGPRPEMPFLADEYTPLQRQRLTVRPGITGIWQISSDRAAPIHENMDYDIYYTENQSILLDMIVVARTIWSAGRGRGAV